MYKPWPIGVYVSYTPVYVREFICDISREPEQVYICTYTPLGRGLYNTYECVYDAITKYCL